MTKYIDGIKYTRVKNLGNYETERIEVYGKVPEGKTPEEVLATLKSWVNQKLNTYEENDSSQQDPEDFDDWDRLATSDPEWYKSE